MVVGVVMGGLLKMLKDDNIKHGVTISTSGHKYKVVFKKNLHVEGDDCFGCLDYKKRKIFIDKDISDTQLMETFLHENLHIIDLTFNLDLGENRINILGLELLRFIRDNNINFLR